MADETTINRISSGLTARFEADGDVSADWVAAYLNEQMACLESHSRITLHRRRDRRNPPLVRF